MTRSKKAACPIPFSHPEIKFLGAISMNGHPSKEPNFSSSLSRRFFIAIAGGTALISGKSISAEDPKAETPKPTGPVEAAFQRDYDEPKFKPSWKKEQINRQMLQDFVIFAHSELEMVKKLLDREPGLLNGAVDWGGGDFETALGGASHMGRRDIAEYLISKGARIDIFCAAMLGQLDAVRAFLTLQPTLIDAKGPHGFSLHVHAQAGGEQSQGVLDYLQSIKKLELRPLPFLKKS
jgi:hypothetical protein